MKKSIEIVKADKNLTFTNVELNYLAISFYTIIIITFIVGY